MRKQSLEVREECHYLASDLATGSIRSDRAGLGSIPGEEYTTILPGGATADGDSALFLPQLKGCQVTKFRAESG